MLDLLDAQPKDRTCIPVGHWDSSTPPKWVMDLPICAEDQTQGTLALVPARGASMVMTSEQWGIKKTEGEQMCRELGSRCTYEKMPTGAN